MLNYTVIKWRARFIAQGKEKWLTVHAIDGNMLTAIDNAKRIAPGFWQFKEVRPIQSSKQGA